jgi:hypothetical protein
VRIVALVCQVRNHRAYPQFGDRALTTDGHTRPAPNPTLGWGWGCERCDSFGEKLPVTLAWIVGWVRRGFRP